MVKGKMMTMKTWWWWR